MVNGANDVSPPAIPHWLDRSDKTPQLL